MAAGSGRWSGGSFSAGRRDCARASRGVNPPVGQEIVTDALQAAAVPGGSGHLKSPIASNHAPHLDFTGSGLRPKPGTAMPWRFEKSSAPCGGAGAASCWCLKKAKEAVAAADSNNSAAQRDSTVTARNSIFILTPGWTCKPTGPDSFAVSETNSTTLLPFRLTE